MSDIQPSNSLTRTDGAFLGSFALLKLLMHLPVLDRYGYHHDELYFLACGEHLGFGYVDHAPLVPWIARLADTLFGASLYGLRIFPLLAGVAAVFLTGLLTRRLGGGRFAQATACCAMLVAPVYVRTVGALVASGAFFAPVSLLVLPIDATDRPFRAGSFWGGQPRGSRLVATLRVASPGLYDSAPSGPRSPTPHSRTPLDSGKDLRAAALGQLGIDRRDTLR